MRNMTRRLFAVFTATMMVAALGLAGCAGETASEPAKDVDPAQEQPNATTTGEGEQGSAEPVKLQIFAANSLTKAMAEAQELYTQQNPHVAFGDTQYEASGTLNEMLGAGQYADVLITASKGTMDTAVEEGYVREDTRQTMFNNDLVIVTKKGGELAGKDIALADIAAGTYTLAVGDENVPAGNYACQALTTVGAYVEPDGAIGAEVTGKGGTFSDALKDKVTLGGKVGDVCKYAESGEVDIAMVYTSDVYRMGGVSIS